MNLKNKLKSYAIPIVFSALTLFGASRVSAQSPQDSTATKKDSISQITPNWIYHNPQFLDSHSDLNFNLAMYKDSLNLTPTSIDTLTKIASARHGEITFKVQEGKKTLEKVVNHFKDRTNLSEREKDFKQKVELMLESKKEAHPETVALLNRAVEDGIINVTQDSLYDDFKEEFRFEKGSYLLTISSPRITLEENPETKQILVGYSPQSFDAFFNIGYASKETSKDTTQTPQEPQEEIFITSKGDTAFSVDDASALEEGYRILAHQDSVMKASEQKFRPRVNPAKHYPTRVDSVETKSEPVQEVQADTTEVDTTRVTPSQPKNLELIVEGYFGGTKGMQVGLQYGNWGFLGNYSFQEDRPNIEKGPSTTGMQGEVEAQNIDYKAPGLAIEYNIPKKGSNDVDFFYGLGGSLWNFKEKQKVTITKSNGTKKFKEEEINKKKNSAKLYVGTSLKSESFNTRLSIGYETSRGFFAGIGTKYFLRGNRK